jgi:hypothetical protein
MVIPLYLLNGFLALLWLTVDHLLLALLVAPLAWLAYTAPIEQRNWTLGSTGLSFLAAALAPMPVPLLSLVMATAGCLAIRVEQLNPLTARWNTVRGLALYGLAGLGYLAYRSIAPTLATDNPLLIQGQTYLTALATFAMYLIPLGFLALLAQSLWAHPPLPGKPADLAHMVRSRGNK